MRKGILLLMAILVSVYSRSQTLTVLNKSGSIVFLTVSGSSANKCDHKYSSVPIQAAPGSTKIFKTYSEITWSGKKPGNSFEYSCLSGMITDPSGACVSNTSNNIGTDKCRMKKIATIDLSKCTGIPGGLTVTWSSKGNDVTVTIESNIVSNQ